MIFKRLICMIQFMTTLPIPVQLELENRDFGKGLVFAPLVGLLIGGILSGAYTLLQSVLPVYAAIVLTVILYILLTGGLHLDGLGDTFDGLFSRRSRERMLEIMRDSRVGTNAVLAVACVLILNIAMLVSFSADDLWKVFLLMPAAGRIGSLIGAGISHYARSGDGLGKSFIDFCGFREVALGGILYLLSFCWLEFPKGILLSIFPVVTAVVFTKYFTGKIGGATGDILGAVCELNQTAFLIAAYFIFK